MQALKDTFMPFGRAGEMNGNYEHSRTGYAERVKEKQAAEGNRKIFFDGPKAGHADGKDDCSGEGGRKNSKEGQLCIRKQWKALQGQV